MARPRLITDEQILTSTRECVLEHGPHVSVDAVAEQLGVTGPALLKRFGSRQELLLRALRPPDQMPFEADFLAGPDERPLEEQLDTLFGKVFEFFEQVLPCVMALRESGIPPDKVWDKKRHSPINAIRVIARWVELGVERGLVATPAPETVATAMLGALQTRAMTAHVLHHSYSSRSNREYLKDLSQLFSRALEVPTSGRRNVKRALTGRALP